MTGFPPRVVLAIVDRDEESCVRCGIRVDLAARGFGWSIHHRRPRGMGGDRDPIVSSPVNGIVLCGSGTTGCHGWVESHREEARTAGLLVSRHHHPELVPVMHWRHGLAFLTEGGWVPVPHGPEGLLAVADRALGVARSRGLDTTGEGFEHIASVLHDLTASWVGLERAS